MASIASSRCCGESAFDRIPLVNTTSAYLCLPPPRTREVGLRQNRRRIVSVIHLPTGAPGAGGGKTTIPVGESVSKSPPVSGSAGRPVSGSAGRPVSGSADRRASGSRTLLGGAFGRVYPVECAGERLLPLCIAISALRLVPLRFPAPELPPISCQFGGSVPVAHGQSRGICRTQDRGLGNFGAYDGNAEHIGLDLHADTVVGDAAVHLEHIDIDARVGPHGFGHIATLVADGLQSRSHDMCARVETR